MKELHFLFSSKVIRSLGLSILSSFLKECSLVFSGLGLASSEGSFHRNPTGSFIILDQLSPLWLKGSPRPTAWSQSSSTWCPRPSSMLVPKPSLVWAPRILYFLLGKPVMASAHATTCPSLYRSELLCSVCCFFCLKIRLPSSSRAG